MVTAKRNPRRKRIKPICTRCGKAISGNYVVEVGGGAHHVKACKAANPSKRKHKKFMKGQGFSGSDIQYVKSRKIGKGGEYLPKKKRANPGASISGWVKAKAVKVVRDAKGRAISLKIRT